MRKPFTAAVLAMLGTAMIAAAGAVFGAQDKKTAPSPDTQFSPRGVDTVRIARWKDDKPAAFCLMFDDSVPSDVTTVVPELKKREMVGTFYINPGGSGWLRNPTAWEKVLPQSPQVVYANHTMTHKGARTVEQLDTELKQCNDVIYRVVPGKQPRLLSFGRPGVRPEDWKVTDAEVTTELAKHHLVERPDFGGHGAMIAFTTAAQMAKLADNAIAKKSMEYVVFHGVGGDWIVTPMETFTQFLDLLSARRGSLWITDHLSAYKYAAERDAATVTVVSTSAKQIQLRLSAKTDAALYDMPLTLVCRVPASWKACEIEQKSGATSQAMAVSGVLLVAALPNNALLTIRPVAAK